MYTTLVEMKEIVPDLEYQGQFSIEGEPPVPFTYFLKVNPLKLEKQTREIARVEEQGRLEKLIKDAVDLKIDVGKGYQPIASVFGEENASVVARPVIMAYGFLISQIKKSGEKEGSFELSLPEDDDAKIYFLNKMPFVIKKGKPVFIPVVMDLPG